ncbi:Bax inhibitor-1/YccA family protein [Desulfonema magnum]|uniref:Bax inhibitor 1-related domain-containing protein n=1 Tax=Desulfonema magnum TaxID=45655 RepID=A0A975GTV0_9BACT|nr:Bax inhibitor-1/YccA family protein [Desulfonema magnum]QTA92518.1 Bax inhibitor 1-related domain-containing protein [Desulfonema magnum]
MEILEKRAQTTEVMVNSFIQSVYNWMAVGLGLTALVAFVVASNMTLLKMMYSVRFLLIIGELALVFILAGRIHKMEASTATALFLFYSALNGATLSVIFMVYTMSSIASTFFVCALTFTACSIYGMVTKRDLTSVGGFMFMGLIGIIIASLVNLFIQSSAMTMIISYLGVFIFIGLTAYDTQKIKAMALSQPAGLDAAVVRKGAIMGALTLYLDFINMFLFLLHILGGGRD